MSYSNGYASVITTGPNASATTTTPVSDTGLPTPPCTCRIRNSTPTADGLHFTLEEIVSVTNDASGTLTITRAVEPIYDGSQSAVDFSGGAAVIEQVLTAADVVGLATVATPVYPLGTLGSTAAPDWANGPSQSGTLSADCTITPAFTGLGASDSTILELWLYEDGTGGWTPTLSGVTWPGGTAPTWDLTAGATNHVVLATPDGGTTVYGLYVGPGPAGLTWKGAWSSATAYVVGDAVSDSGSSYICTAANTNHVPPNVSYWDVLAAQGASGGGGVDNCAVVARTAGDVVLGVATWTDLTGMTVTLTTGAHRCRVLVNFIYSTAGGGCNFQVDVDIDGTRIGGALGCWSIYGGAIISQPGNFAILTPVLSAGSHTIKLRYQGSNTNNFTMFANANNPAFFQVEETGLTS